jgi:hypothetical protein
MAIKIRRRIQRNFVFIHRRLNFLHFPKENLKIKIYQNTFKPQASNSKVRLPLLIHIPDEWDDFIWYLYQFSPKLNFKTTVNLIEFPQNLLLQMNFSVKIYMEDYTNYFKIILKFGLEIENRTGQVSINSRHQNTL